VINAEQTVERVSLLECSFTSSNSPSFIHIASSNLDVDGCHFEQTSNNDAGELSSQQIAALRPAGAIASEGRSIITTTNSRFSNILSSYGVVVIREVAISGISEF
jgi:hypothetical protein